MDTYDFGEFNISPTERRLLRKNGEAVPLTPRVFDLLLTLVINNDRVLTKDELLDAVWVDCIVEESNLSQSIFVLRKALGDTANNPTFIRTVPQKGYRFIAPVKAQPNGFQKSDLLKNENNEAELSVNSTLEIITPPLPEPLTVKARPSVRAAFVVIALIGLALSTILGFYYSQAVPKPIKSIAVFPFINASGDTSVDYLTDGLSENVTNKLARIQNLKVLARSVVAKYKGKEVDPITAGNELKADAILIGHLSKPGDLLNIRIELIQVSNGTLLWGENYSRRASDVVSLQDEITRHTTDNLHFTLTADDKSRLSKRYTENSEAYALYLRGQAFWRKGYTLENYQKAIEYYNQALALDPNFALAYAGIADCHNMIAENKFAAPVDEFPKAKAASLHAIEIDENLAEAHIALALTKFYYEWDWSSAEAEFQRAIELNPNNAQSHFWYSLLLRALGRTDQALTEIKIAEEIDPIYLDNGMGTMLYHLRQYEQAISHYSNKLELEPDNINAHAWLFQLYAVRGMKKESLRELETTFKLIEKASPNSMEAKFAHINFGRGYDPAMRQMIQMYSEESKNQYVSAYDFARAYALIDDRENTIQWLEKAFEEHSGTLSYVGIEPMWDNIRQEPRFKDLLRRMNLENIKIPSRDEIKIN